MPLGHVACFQWLITRTEASLRLLCHSLYIYTHSFTFHFFFSQRIYNQSATVILTKFAYHLLRATVSHSLLLSPTGKYFYLMLNFFATYLNFCTPVIYVNRQSLRVYPSHVGDRCLVRRVNNCVSAREWAMMRCFRQVLMTPAPQVMKGNRWPPLLPQGMRTWTWMVGGILTR